MLNIGSGYYLDMDRILSIYDARISENPENYRKIQAY